MINARGLLVVILASLALVTIASANGDPTPDKTVTVDCEKVRALVEQYGVEAVIAAARARGVPERTIDATARRCLR